MNVAEVWRQMNLAEVFSQKEKGHHLSSDNWSRGIAPQKGVREFHNFPQFTAFFLKEEGLIQRPSGALTEWSYPKGKAWAEKPFFSN